MKEIDSMGVEVNHTRANPTNFLSGAQREQLLNVSAYVIETGPLADSPVHGDRHWRSVAMIGSQLAAETPGADVFSVLVFALLHDARRVSEHHDPEHGRRAALLLDELMNSDVVSLPADVRTRLWDGLDRHAQGQTTLDPIKAVCWDADRLCLPRVGIAVDPNYLSAPESHYRLTSSLEAVYNPCSWEEIVNSYAVGCRRSRLPRPTGEQLLRPDGETS